MRNYTEQPFICEYCGKKNYFMVKVVTEGEKSFYLTQCPHCKHHDEVRPISKDEGELHK